MMDTVPKLVPMWHDLASQDFVRLNKVNAKFGNLKLPDHGGIGIDINSDGDVLTYEVAKHPKNHINFAAKSCALPFLPLRKVPNVTDPCIEPLKKEGMDFFKFCLKLKYVRNAARGRKTYSSDLKSLRQELQKARNTCNYGTSIEVPKSISELAEHLPKRPFVPTFNVAYAGGNLAVCRNSSKQSLLHPSCEVTSKLCITPIQDHSDGHFEPILSNKVSVCLKDEPILQIESILNEFCCIRQKGTFHLLNVDNLKLTSKTVDKIMLYHIAACPYNPVEILSVYEKGMLKLRNMETRKTVWSIQDYSCHDPTLLYPTWRCGFGSHPFSAVCMNEKYLSSSDFRTKEDMKILFSVQNPSCYVSEELVALKQWDRNPFQHFLASSHHLIICDERYPKRPVMYLNHTLRDYPVYCEIANLENSTNSVIVIGTQGSRELSAFFIDSPQTQIQPVSLGPLLTLSSPSDCIDSLKLHCYSVNETFSSRLAFPLSGLCVVPQSQNRTFTVFQSTSVSDIFHQNFKETFSKNFERTYHVGAGCVLTPPETILPHVKDWISKIDSFEESESVDESYSRLLVDVTKILDLPKKISASCSLCRLSSASNTKELVLSEVCPTCNLDSAESQHFCRAMTTLTAVVSPASEEPNFLECDIDYLARFTDKYSKNILSVWLEPGDVNEMSQTSATAETHLDSADGCQSINLNISSQESNASFCQDENISIHANSQLGMEASYYDFAEDTRDYLEMVPPSQEVRTLIGETILTPVRAELNRSKIKRSSTAGF